MTVIVLGATEAQFNAGISKPTTYILLAISLILLQYVLTIYFFTMKARTQVFRGKFMEQFNKQHHEAFPHLDKSP